ncbi:hypothetical protein D3C76_1273190 [compost metagenome]
MGDAVADINDHHLTLGWFVSEDFLRAQLRTVNVEWLEVVEHVASTAAGFGIFRVQKGAFEVKGLRDGSKIPRQCCLADAAF